MSHMKEQDKIKAGELKKKKKKTGKEKKKETQIRCLTENLK